MVGISAVKFIRNYRNYYRGDVAGFVDELAARLVDEGFAEAYHEPAAPEPQAKAVDGPPVDRAMHRESTARKENPL